MNVAEIAEMCGKSEKTIRNWINKVYPGKAENGKETDLSLPEVEGLFNNVLGETITAMIMQAAIQNDKVAGNNVQVAGNNFQPFTAKDAMEMMAKMIPSIVAETVKSIQQTQRPLQISYDKDLEYITAKGYCISNGVSLSSSSIQALGKMASKYCRDNDIAISNVPDERWGRLNTYPYRVLDSIYKSFFK